MFSHWAQIITLTKNRTHTHTHTHTILQIYTYIPLTLKTHSLSAITSNCVHV